MGARRPTVFITDVSIDAVFKSVIEAVRRTVLGAIGVGLAGSLRPSSAAVYRFAAGFPMAPAKDRLVPQAYSSKNLAII